MGAIAGRPRAGVVVTLALLCVLLAAPVGAGTVPVSPTALTPRSSAGARSVGPEAPRSLAGSAAPVPSATGTWIDGSYRAVHFPYETTSLVDDTSAGYVLQFGGDLGTPNILEAGSWAYRNGTWTNLSPLRSPPARDAAAMAYDPSAEEDVMFGGFANCTESGCSSVLRDTWTFADGNWTEVPSNGPPPPGRAGAAMAYDPSLGGVVLFGGVEANGTLLADTWAFVNGSWAELAPRGSPPGLYRPGLAYDAATAGLVLFGGIGGAPDRYVLTNETWTFAEGAWKQVDPASSPPPPADGVAMAAEPGDATILLEEHDAGAGPSTTWAFGSDGWTNVTPAGPAPPAGAQNLVTDASDGYVLDAPFPAVGLNASTYGFANGSWRIVSASPSLPSPRAFAAIAPDPSTGTALLFGGTNGTAWLGDTWSSNGTAWTRSSGAGGPSPRAGAALAFLPSDHAFVMFGGEGSEGLLNDSWTYANGSWTRLAPAEAPPPQAFGCLVDDPALGALVYFGGEGTSGSVENDTWEFAGGSWSAVRGPAPPARAAAACAYDALSRQVILMGGTSAMDGATVSGAADADVWAFSSEGWENVTADGGPSARAGASMVSLGPNGTGGLLLFGGVADGTLLNDSWLWDGTGWSPVVPPAVPPVGIEGSAGAYYPRTAAVELFGGFATPSSDGDGDGDRPVPGSGSSVVAIQRTYVYDRFAVAPTFTDERENPPLTVAVRANPSATAGPLRVLWRFGDGAVADSVNASHTYGGPGSRNVSLEIVDPWGRGYSVAQNVSILPSPPLLTVAAQPASSAGPAPLTVAFSANASGGIPPYTYAWNFGDGFTGTGAALEHLYAAPGNYSAEVDVADAGGGVASAEVPVEVENGSNLAGPLGLDAQLSTVEGPAPLRLAYAAVASGGLPPYAFAWFFGAVGTSTSASGNVTLNAPGTYRVALTVSDLAGARLTREWNVTVTGGGGLAIGSAPPTPDAWAVPLAVGLLVAGAVVALLVRARLAARPPRGSRAGAGDQGYS